MQSITHFTLISHQVLSTAFFAEEYWLDINMAYTYELACGQVQKEYQQGIRILGETGYEGEANTGFVFTPYLVRRQGYWALLSGAAGHAYGNATIWHFGDGWKQALNKPGLCQMAHVKTLFDALPWWTLSPDLHGSLVLEGGGTYGKDDYVTAVRSPKGELVIAYLPSPRTVVVNLGRMSGTANAWWYSPHDGKCYDAQGQTTQQPFGSFLNHDGWQPFTPPSAEENEDWILLLTDPAHVRLTLPDMAQEKGV